MSNVGSIAKIAVEESKYYQLVKSKERQTELGEVFTPTKLVLNIIKKLSKDKSIFEDETKTFLDPSCGNGQFLIAILITKMYYGHSPEQALSTIYGVDIMKDNIIECRKRLFNYATKDMDDITEMKKCMKIIKKNIVRADALEYDFNFGEKEKA